jgi:eukaryotic-like serine/threonine-protein kinase
VSAVVESERIDLSGQHLGAYRLVRMLGEGAMGTVYLGTHGRIGRNAAIKVLKPEHVDDPDLVKRFIHEAQAVNAIKNEHIVEVYDFGEQLGPDGRRMVFCIMELLEGDALADIMLPRPFSVRASARIVQQLSAALDAAHRVGVVHRDVKPENLFIMHKNDELFVKVLDFGVAKLFKPIGDVPISQTQAGTIIGTPEYMAPEQALGQTTDVRVDVYAIGLVLYELLTGQRPFTGATFGKLVVELTQKPPPPLPLKSLAGDPIPPGLEAVMRRCLEKKPEARYQTAADVALALEPYTQAIFPHQVPSVGPPLPEVPLVPPRSIGPLLVGGLLAVALASTVTWLVWPQPAPGLPLAPIAIVPPAAAQPLAPVVASEVATLLVTSTPPGAEVRHPASGKKLGVTPLRLQLPPVQALTLELSLAGHQTIRREVNLIGTVTLAVDLPLLLRPKLAGPPSPGKQKRPANRDQVVDPFAP